MASPGEATAWKAVLVSSVAVAAIGAASWPLIQHYRHKDEGGKKLFVFGLGYCGVRAAIEFRRQGFRVAGTVRSHTAAKELRSKEGIETHVFSDTSPLKDPEKVLRGVTHILITAPPTKDGDPVLSSTLKDALLSLEGVEWVGYLSTTAVYGDCGGGVVEEDSPLQPMSTRGRLRVLAEEQWRTSGLPVHIFRLPGIYGPGRGTIPKVREGTARRILKEGQVFNRIHVDDIVQALTLSAAAPKAGSIYNVADDYPCSPAEPVEFAAKLLKMQPPPAVPWEEAEKEMSAMARSFYSESKRASNKKIKTELGLKLKYPTYREGFVAQLVEEEAREMEKTLSWSASLDRLLSHLPTWKREPKLQYLLVDVGSLAPGATLNLRQLATILQQKVGKDGEVHACSCRFADKIDKESLGGEPAELLQPLMERLLSTGQGKEFIILPLMFGPTKTLTEFIPQRVAQIRRSWPEVRVHVAEPIITKKQEDNRVALILKDRLLEQAAKVPLFSLTEITVVLVDHGSPSKDVTAVRDFVAAQLTDTIGSEVRKVIASSMERREGEEYAFNEPLLESVFEQEEAKADEERASAYVVLPLFFSPGRHAGPDGDIAQIVERVKNKFTTAGVLPPTILLGNVLGSHQLLVDILYDRLMDTAGHKTL